MSKRVLGGLYIFLGSFCFSTKAIMIKMAYSYPGIDAVDVLTLRMLFALPFFIVIGYFNTINSQETNLTKSDWLKMVGLGLIGYYISSIFDFKGLEYVSAGLERLILFAYPTIVILISSIFYKQPITKYQYLALGITYLGIGFAIIPDGQTNSPNLLIGSFYIVGAAITYAIYLVESGRLIPKIGPIRFTSITMSFAAVGICIHFIIVNGFELFKYPLEVYGICLLMAIVATVIPTFLLSAGMQLIGSGNSAIISTIGPVSTIFLAYIFLHESLNSIQYLGMILVLFGVILITFKKQKVN